MNIEQYVKRILVMGEYVNSISGKEADIAKEDKDVRDGIKIAIESAEKDYPNECAECKCETHGLGSRLYWIGAMNATLALGDAEDSNGEISEEILPADEVVSLIDYITSPEVSELN